MVPITPTVGVTPNPDSEAAWAPALITSITGIVPALCIISSFADAETVLQAINIILTPLSIKNFVISRA